ncbi:MAG TPA: hypothetical protein VF202_06315 [Trueperaceae bacterium]
MAVMRPPSRPETLPLSAALRSAFLGYCPNCMLGRIFRGLLRPKAACDVCGMLFEHQGETCTATAVILYFLICFGLGIEGLTLGLIFGLFPGFIPLLIVSAAVMFVVLHRPVRGLWVWCLWRLGFLQ